MEDLIGILMDGEPVEVTATDYHRMMQLWSQLKVMRLYDKDGNHIASLVGCMEDDRKIDLCTPSGKNLWCGFGRDIIPFIRLLALEAPREV